MVCGLCLCADGSPMMVCVGRVWCVSVRKYKDMKQGAVVTAGYNTKKGRHKELPYYRPFDVSGPKTQESR